MALLATVQARGGVAVQSAYVRVTNPHLIGKRRLSFLVKHFKDSAASDDFDGPVRAAECAFDLNGPNPFVQAYNHLKTLPEFAGAVDC